MKTKTRNPQILNVLETRDIIVEKSYHIRQTAAEARETAQNIRRRNLDLKNRASELLERLTNLRQQPSP